MSKKRIALTVLIIVLAALAGAYFFYDKKSPDTAKTEPAAVQKDKTAVSAKQTPVKQVEPEPVKFIPPVKKSYDLYSATPYDLPLYSIMEISSLSDNMKKLIDRILEDAQGFYLLKTNEGTILIILQNPINSGNTYSRHDLEFVEITPDGNTLYTFGGYAGEENEIANAVSAQNKGKNKTDEWKFDKSTEPYRPVKHIKYDEEGNVKFTEVWNYSSDDNIKYEMKDGDNNVLSILKETLEGDTNYRKEHIFYDREGNVKMSITVNFDGADITRFTYYTPDDSISIMSEYTDGLKTKESVYNKDYQLVNILTAEYENGERTSITLHDKTDTVLKKIER